MSNIKQKWKSDKMQHSVRKTIFLRAEKAMFVGIKPKGAETKHGAMRKQNVLLVFIPRFPVSSDSTI